MSAISDFFARFKKRNIKRIYFVRHGETIMNAQHLRQGADGQLSEKGIQQANQTGERLKSFPIDIIISSSSERARQTAGIINSYVNKPIEDTPLLMERKNPSEVIGKWFDDPEVRKIIDKIDKGFHEANFRYSDEENYEDLKARAEKVLDFLAAHPQKNILCVTHGIFLTMIIAVLQYRDTLTAEDYIKLSYYNQAKNAGITVCEYDASKTKEKDRGWSLLVWDDYPR